MIKPRLIHPVTVVISKVDPDRSKRDPDTLDPKPGPDSGRYGQGADAAIEKTYTLKAQPSRTREQMLEPGQAGDVPDALGHLTFTRRGLETAGLMLAKGDKITSIGGEAKDLYVVDLVPCGTYGGVMWMVKAYYGDRPKGK